MDGSVQQMLPESVTLNGGAIITRDLLAPGTPTVRLNGKPNYSGSVDGPGEANPSNFQVTLNGGSSLRHVVRRTNPVALPVVAAPPLPTGNRAVTISSQGQTAGDFSSVRDLTLNGGVGQVAVPPGTYGDFIANGGSGFTLGVAGSTEPTFYHFQRLTLNGQSEFRVVAPVVLTVANGFAANGVIGASHRPAWLTLRVFSGPLTLNGTARLFGHLVAPNSTVTINGGSQLVGGLIADRLIVNGSGLLKLVASSANQAPTAQPQAITTVREVAVDIILSGNDPEGEPLVFSIITPPSHGSLVPVSDTPATFRYQPQPHYIGSDAFTFVVNDGALNSPPAKVTITVTPPTQPPVAYPQSVTVAEDSVATVTLSGADPAGLSLTYIIVTPPLRGSLETVPESLATFKYTPEEGFNGTDRFTFKVNNGELDSSPATVEIEVTPVNHAPLAEDQSLTLPRDGTIDLTLHASDVDGDTLVYSIVTLPAHGALTGEAPNLTYTPSRDYIGADSFTFKATDPSQADSNVATVSITVVHVNRPPVARVQSFTLPEDTVVAFALDANDPDGDPLTFTVLTPPQHGALLGTAPLLSYRPDADYHGPDSFNYRVSDGATFAEATVSFTVTPVNDAPVAEAQAVSTPEDVPLVITLTGYDADEDPLTYEIVTSPQHGTLTAPSAGSSTASYTYTPATDYFGPDSFTFRVYDGKAFSAAATVAVTVSPENDAPTALPKTLSVAANGSVEVVLQGTDIDSETLTFRIVGQPANGTLTGSGANLTYAPNYGYSGGDSFTYVAHDGELDSASATVTITVHPPIGNQAPRATLSSIMSVPLPLTAFELLAAALDADGTVRKVEFFRDGVLLGQAVKPVPGESSVYSYLVSAGLPPGTYTFTARATDDQGATAVSNTVAVTIDYDPRSRVFTTTGDFNSGTIVTLRSEDDQLTTSFFPSSYDFVWISNSSRGTVVRLDTETARVLGEYRTSPEGTSNFPSSIAIDSRGNAWIANRSANTIVKIGLGLDNDHWIDRNGDGVPTTSQGQSDILSWPAAGQPTDEHILLWVSTKVSGLDHIAVDQEDNVWVGGYGGKWQLFDGRTGALLREENHQGAGGRGGFIDSDGVQVSTGVKFLHWDTRKPITEYDRTFVQNVRQQAWGVARDVDGNYWITKDWSTTVEKYSPAGALLGAYYHGSQWGQGIAIGPDGHIWIAHSHCGDTVGHLLPDGTWLGNVKVANHGPTEVSIDRHGRVWVVSTTGVVERINPLGGPIGKDGITPVGEKDLRSPQLGGTLWTYGKFVGNRGGVFLQNGIWRFAYDSQIPNANWGSVLWNALLSNDALVGVEVATSEDGNSFGPWEALTLEQPIPAAKGRFLRGRVTLAPATTGESPILFDLTIGTNDYREPTIPRRWFVSAGDDLTAQWPDEVQLKGAIWHSAHAWAEAPTFVWSFVSFTPLSAGTGSSPAGGAVTFSNPSDPRSKITFSGVGEYVLRLTATVNGVTSTDDVQVRVIPYNKMPYVAAGEHLFLREASEEAILDGIARDDGLPLGGTFKVTWEKAFGPGTVTFADPNSALTTAKFSLPGTYVLRIRGNDGELESASVMSVYVGLVCTDPPPSGLISWWQGNGGGSDHISGNQAFPENGANFAEGYAGPAFNFNGTNNRVLVFGNDTMDVGMRGGIGLEFWVHPVESREATLLEYGRDAATRGFSVKQSGTTLRVDFRDTAGVSHEVSVSSALPIGVWTHVSINYDRTTGRADFHINGAFRQSSQLGAFDLQTSYDFRMGMSWANDRPFRGKLDEISLYERPLNLAESWRIYNAGDAGKRRPVTNAAPVVNGGGPYLMFDASTPLQLAGSVTDDGLPSYQTVRYRWNVLGTPAGQTATLADSTSLTTQVSFSGRGYYYLELYADDGAFCSREVVPINVGMSNGADKPKEMVAWWPGNYTTEEVITSRYGDGVNVHYNEGKVGGAFEFNSTSRHIVSSRVTGQTDIGTFATGFTIEFWVRNGGTDGNGRRVLSWAASTTEQLRVEMRAGGWDHVRLETGTVRWDIPGLPSSSTWRHVAFAYDRTAGRMRLYRDGVLISDMAASTTAFANISGGDLYFGGLPFQSSSDWMRGGLDEVSFYNRPLTNSEIVSIYNAGTVGKEPSDNQSPRVFAGEDQVLPELGGSTSLTGQVSDDGLPAGQLLLEWSQIYGPENAAIASPTQAQTQVTFGSGGLYGFKLTASDGLKTTYDVVEVRVNATGASALPGDIVAWWPGNHTTEEVVKNRFEHGVNVTYTTGKVGGAFDFNATNRHVYAPKVAGQTDVGTFAAGFTMEFWVKNTASDGGGRRVMSWAASTTEQLRVEMRAGGWDHVRLETGTVRWDIPGLPAGPTWRHVAFAYDRTAGRMRLYRDGVLISDTAASTTAFANVSGGDLYFGGLPFQSAGDWMHGGLDEVSFYSRPLTNSEIVSIYNAGTLGKEPISDNQPPLVSAGADQVLVEFPGQVTLLGQASDDGLPSGHLKTQWTQIFGPAAAIAAAADLQTQVSFSESGLYGFRLSATDGMSTSSDVVEVRVAATGAAALPGNIVAWWPGNHTTEEVVKNRFEHGVNVTYATGKVGGAFDFNATNRHVYAPKVAGQTDVGTFAAGFTMEFWVKNTASDGGGRRVMSWAASTTEQLRVEMRAGGWDHVRLETGTVRWDIPGLPAGPTWRHVAFAYDRAAGRMRLYRDGVLISDTAASTTAFANVSGGDLYFGGLPFQSAGDWMHGGLDEVSFYSRPLTNSEIVSIYNAGTLGKEPISDNQPPLVSAGADQVLVEFPGQVTLLGQASDDGLPSGHLKTQWTQIFGPAAAIAAAADLQTQVSFSESGLYGFRLSATDGMSTSSDVVEVRVAATGASALPGDIVAWWPGNHTTEEVVKNRFEHGVNVTYAAGRVGGGYDFNATNRHVYVPKVAGQTDIGTFANGFTIEFWVKNSGTDGSGRRVLSWAASTTEQLRIEMRAGGWDHVRLDSGSGYWEIPGLPSSTTWRHVAFAYDRTAGRMRLYRDGVLISDTAASTSAFATRTDGDLYIGGLPFHSASEWMRGGLDEVSFYSRPLTNSEIVSIYNAGTLGKEPISDNQPPLVSAGADQVLVEFPGQVTLLGQASDDGLPSGHLKTQWTQLFGPTATIAAAANSQTQVSFNESGIYGFRLSATDGMSTSSDVVEVRVATTGAAALPGNIVAWWPGNYTTEEVVKNRFEHGVNVTYAAGRVGGGYDFNATNRHVYVPKVAGQTDIGTFANGFTIEFWVKNSGTDGSGRRVLSWAASTTEQLRIEMRAGGWDHVRLDSGSGYWEIPGLPSSTTWRHVAFAYDRTAGRMRLYRDGVLISDTAASTSAFATRTDGDLYIGGLPFHSASEWMRGGLDEVSFYSRPLTNSEIVSIYNAGQLGKQSPAAIWPPVVQLIQPTHGSSISVGAPVAFVANVLDPQGSVQSVSFFDGQTLLGTVTTPDVGNTSRFTYYHASGLAYGSHTVTAVATGATGLNGTSKPATVSAVHGPPVVAMIQPTDNASVAALVPLSLVAQAAYEVGSIAKVEFFDGSRLVGEVSTPDSGSPMRYTFNLTSGLSAGAHTLSARATGTDGISATSAPVRVSAGLVSPTVTLTAPTGGSTIAANSAVTLKANATVSAGSIAKIEFFNGSVRLGETTTPDSGTTSSYSFVVTGGFAVGTHALTAKATAQSGATATSTPVSVSVVNYTGSAVVEIATPLEDALLTAPAPVTGVVFHSSLSSWALEYRMKVPAGTTAEPWTVLQTGNSNVGTPAIGASAAVPGALGTFDPTLLLNGTYELRLRVATTTGTVLSTTPIPITVEGGLKLGHFSVAFTDLSVPTAGFPIELTRTYDSRDPRGGDFGPGWRLSLDAVRVQKSRPLALGWEHRTSGSSLSTVYYIEPTKAHRISISFPDGETHIFEAGIYVPRSGGPVLPDNYRYLYPVTEGRLVFKAIGSTSSTLAVDGDNSLVFSGQLGEEMLTQDYWEPFEPTRFRLTTKDGTIFVVDERVGLMSLRDASGNTLALNRNASNRVTSITSTENVPGGAVARTITVTRDATGRIDYLTDLANKTIDYIYDAQGRLGSVTNRELNTTQFRYEYAAAPHYLTKIIDPRGVTALRSEYDDQGRLVKQIDASGKETVFARGVDPIGPFQRVTDRLGHATTYYYDDRGNVTAKLDPMGALTTYDYDPDTDRVVREIDHYGNVKSFAHDARGNVTVETIGAAIDSDPANPTMGYVTRTSYTAFSAPTSIKDPDGREQTFTYDASNNLKTHTVGAGTSEAATTTYTYNSDGSIATITDALGTVTSYTYQRGFSDTAYPGAVKRVTTTVTDGSAAVLRVTRSLYDVQENLLAEILTRTLPAGGTEDVVTRYRYDAENRLRATIHPDGRVSETRYTSFGAEAKTLLWTSVAAYENGAEAQARVTSYTYDDRGNRTGVVHPDSTSEEFGYDAENRMTWKQDQRGYRTFMVYDKVGRQTFTIHPDDNDGVGSSAPSDPSDPRLSDNPRTETVYDLIGRVINTYDELRRRTQFTYEDGCGCAMRRKSMIQHLSTGNLTTSYEYDKAGHVRFVTDPRSNTTETRYDAHGRPTATVHPATDEHPATQTVTRYDALGRRIAITDQEGKITRYRYDGLGRLIEVRQYLDQSLAAGDESFALAWSAAGVVSTRYSYDQAGNQRSQTDALGRVTTYEYDNAGRRQKRLLPKDAAESATLTETLQYDEWGNLWTRTDFAGHTTTFGYDPLGRLKTKTADANHPSLTYGHAIARIEYDYDATGARTAARTFSAANTQLYSESTPRDVRGRISHKESVLGRLSYDYHANGLLKDVVSSNADGVNIGYRYDEANRLAFVDNASQGVPAKTTSYTYNGNGSLQTLTYANGLSHTYSYDALNRLRSLQVAANTAPVHSYTYNLRASGHRRQVVEGTKTTTYDYDALYRLTGETVAGVADPGRNGTVTYELDKVGNRLSRTSSISPVSTVTGQSYNARDWLNSDTYNANGSTVQGATSVSSAGSFTDRYDFEERLIVRTKSDGSSISISYNADGIRRQKTILNTASSLVSTTTYLTDTNNLTGYAQVLEERTTTGTDTIVKVYTYGSDLISRNETTASSSNVRYFGYDGGGSVRELTDETGAVTDRYDYDAFGLLLFRSGSSHNVYLYRGEQWDEDVELYYLRSRFHNKNTGRFWNRDTYEGRDSEPPSLHKYLYANANPVSMSDPTGNFATVGQMNMTVAIVGTLAALALPSTQRIIQEFGEAAVGVVGEIGESAFGMAQQAAGMAAIAIALTYDGLHDQIEKAIRGMADEMKDRLRRLKVVPISFSMMPHIAKHVQDAQGGPLRPEVLVRTTSATAKLNRRDAIAGRGSAGPGMSWDEYPFASTTKGGAGASVRSVPLHENLVQGGVIGASYRVQNIMPGDSFWVLVIP